MISPALSLMCFSSDFFNWHIVWNTNRGEPAAAKPETEAKEEWEDNKTQEEIKIVAQLDLASAQLVWHCSARYTESLQRSMARSSI